MQNPAPTLEQEQELQVCDLLLDVEAQSAQCKKPHLSSSCEAIVAPAPSTSGDDAACNTTSDSEDAPPFCIRGYAAAVREINISKCWPFSQQLLEESIREGKHPHLPPLSPCACVVKVIPEHYQDGTGESAQDEMGEACGANDGPQLQVQIDLSKSEAEIDSHECAAGTCAPAKPLTPSLEEVPLQEPQEPFTSSFREDAGKHKKSFGDFPLVFKRQAPRSIREIRNSLMQGCQCLKLMGVTQACKKDSCSKSFMLPPTPVHIEPLSIDALDGHSHDGQLAGDHENVSGVTQLESMTKRPYHSEGVAYSHSGPSQPTMYRGLGEMHDDVNYTNKQPVMLVASVPLTSQVDAGETSASGKDMSAHTRSDNTHKRGSVSDSQSVDKSHESHSLRSTSSRQCWDTTTQQGSPDNIACLDNVLQQRCPVCLIFQSSSNTALNVHIDRCLAALSVEEGTTKSKQKVKVRKKRSMAELCLIAPSSITGGENTLSDCNTRGQNATKKAAVENKDKTTKRQSEVWKPKTKVNTLKLLQWGSRSSTRHGASRRGPIHEARTRSMKKQSLQGRTLEWRTTSVLQNTNKWERQKTSHEPDAELPQNVQLVPEKKAQKFRKLIQKNKGRQNQNTEHDATQKRNSGPRSTIDELSRKLNGRVLSKHKTAALRAVLQSSEKHSSKASKEASHILTSDAHLAIIGSHETTVKVLHTDNVVNAEIEQGDKTKEKVKLRVLLQPTKQHKNKRKQKPRADPQEASDLQVAIITVPSVPKKVRNAESQPVRTDGPLKQQSMQAHLGIADGSLETQMPSQPNVFQKRNCNPENLRRTAGEQAVQGPCLRRLSAMMEDYQSGRRKPPSCRKVQISSTHNSAPSCSACNGDVLQSNKTGIFACLEDANTVDVSHLALGAQPTTKMSSTGNSAVFAVDTWQSCQQETEQVQVNDSHHAQASHFLSTTTSLHSDSVSTQQFGPFPFSFSAMERPRWPRQLDEQSFATAGSERLLSPVPSQFVQSLEVAKRTFGTSFTSQGFDARQESLKHDDNGIKHTGRHMSALQKIAEARQYNPGSAQSIFYQNAASAQNPSFLGSSNDNILQAHSHSQLPPWMEAAIHDQRSTMVSSACFSTNSSCQSILPNTTPNISPEMSRTLSMLQMIGTPVLRLMGKTMVLRPDVNRGHVDINTVQDGGQSTYINFFQSLEPEEATHEAQNQDQPNINQRPNLQMQPGIQPEYLASDEYICRSEEVQSWTSSESRPIPQLQDFFCRTPSMSGIPLAHQPANPHRNTLNLAEQHCRLLQGGSQLLSGMSHTAQLNWQHQKATNSPLNWPEGGLCCPQSTINQMRTNLEFSTGGVQRGSFRSNLVLPQALRKVRHCLKNVKAGKSSYHPSWFSSAMNRVSPSEQPANIIILDEEDPLCAFNISASEPTGQGVVGHSNRPEVSAAQHNSMPAQCRAYLADSSKPARAKPNNDPFIPIIYTVGGGSVEPTISPGSFGPNAQKSATTAHEQRQVKSSGRGTNPRKRVSCVEQPGHGAKHLKTSESTSPAPHVSRVDHGKACGLGPSESRRCTANPMPSMNALQAASEWIKSAALGGSISVSERFNQREPSSVQPEQDTVQGQPDLNGGKETRSQAPAVGMCSTNMNPAEVDCHDIGQFTPTPALDIVSEPSPVNDAQARMNMHVAMCPHPCTPTPNPKSSNWPLLSSAVTTLLPRAGFQSSVALPSTTSLLSPNIVSQSFNRKAASKEKSSFPVIYSSSKPPSFCPNAPIVNWPCSLIPEGVAQEFVSPAIHPSIPASALSSQEKHLFKAARKFVIMNGRVSIMGTQKHKDAMQKDRQSVRTTMQQGEECMHLNETANGSAYTKGRKQQVTDAMRQHESIAKALGIDRAFAGGCNDEHESALTTKLLTKMRASAVQETGCKSR